MPKLMDYGEALNKLRRIFPGHEVTVYDGDACQESGLVEDTIGTKLASFRLTLKQRTPNTIPEVSKVRVGAVGQFCGSVDEIKAW